MPFSEIDNSELDELFPKPYFPEEYEVGYDADGNEWVHARGVWYPCVEDQGETIPAAIEEWWRENTLAEQRALLAEERARPICRDEDDQDDQDPELPYYNLEDVD